MDDYVKVLSFANRCFYIRSLNVSSSPYVDSAELVLPMARAIMWLARYACTRAMGHMQHLREVGKV